MIDLVARAEGYRLLGFALRYPDDELAPGLADAALSPSPVDELAALAALVDDALAGEHNRLFATSVAVPPYESSYVRTDKGIRMGQLAALYAAFGFRTGGRERELADHVGTEAQFVAALAVMQELARRRGDAGGAEVAAGARALLVREHVGRWFVPFAERLAERTVHPYYRALAAWIARFVALDLSDHGWAGRPATPPRDEADEPCVVCPMAPDVQGDVP